MFNVFKSNKNVIPNDLSKGMMTSNFCSLKIGEKLTIPENTICLVCYKDKVYAELASGIYPVTRELLLDLYEKQAKNDKKLKHLKTDLYFANLDYFEYDFTYVDKIPLNERKSKIIIDCKTKISIDDVRLFYKFVVFDWASADAINTEQQVLNYLEEGLRKFFLKIKLNSLFLSQEQSNEMQQRLTKHLSKIGVNLEYLSINLSSKSTIIVKENASNFFNEKNSANQPKTENLEILIDSNKIMDYTNQEASKIEQNMCSNCGSKIVKGSLYCHRCGNKL